MSSTSYCTLFFWWVKVIVLGGLNSPCLEDVHCACSGLVCIAHRIYSSSVMTQMSCGRCSITWNLSCHMLSQDSDSLSSRGQDSHSELKMLFLTLSLKASDSGINRVLRFKPFFCFWVFRSFVLRLSCSDPVCAFSESPQPVFRENTP